MVLVLCVGRGVVCVCLCGFCWCLGRVGILNKEQSIKTATLDGRKNHVGVDNASVHVAPIADDVDTGRHGHQRRHIHTVHCRAHVGWRTRSLHSVPWRPRQRALRD